MTDKPKMPGAQSGTVVEIIDLRNGTHNFASDVREGLTATPKTLNPRHFYDALGSVLFNAICHLDEYYVAREEDAILHASSNEIVGTLPQPIRLVELGSGTASKTRRVIDAALQRQPGLDYFAVDIDAATLRATADMLSTEYGTLRVTGFAATFEDGLREVGSRLAGERQQTLMLFLGSTIGNLDPGSQRDILRSIRAALQPGDALLLGTDLVKSEEVLIPAYDDVLGVTAAFNRNLLVRINRELGGTFDVKAFRHEARYNPTEQRIEMHLVSTARQKVAISAAGVEVEFADGESIHTESSYKFTHETVALLATDSGFRLQRQWTDKRGWFGENLLIAI